DQIIMTFEPAVLNGVITQTDQATGETVPVAGAIVRIQEDLNGDGTIDFAAEAVTDANGHYSIAIPREADYQVQVTRTIGSGSNAREITYIQNAPVPSGAITGTGQEFQSSETLSGLVGSKLPDGNMAF